MSKDKNLVGYELNPKNPTDAHTICVASLLAGFLNDAHTHENDVLHMTGQISYE